ncbi:MAG: DUF302 domain-containing protein [Acidimicrobiia bacterium]|jgi:uncharacterized protein (DUF302 family)
MIEEAYGLTITTDMAPPEAEAAIRDALAEEGFGILTEIDVKATLAEKLGVDYRPYKILGACNPNLAHSALDADERIGLLLPCNVIVAATDDGRTVVSILDPDVMGKVTDATGVVEVAAEARSRLERALSAFSRQAAGSH